MRRIKIAALATFTSFGILGACGGDKSEPSGTGATSTNAGNTNSGNTNSGTNTGTGGASSTGSSTTGSVSDCTNTAADGLGPEEAEIPAAIGVYSYGDGVTTHCISPAGMNQVCLEGLGADSDDGMNEYANWGAGIGIQLGDEGGWDATAAGVAAVRFSISGASASAPVRMGITMANTGDVDFENQGFADYSGGVSGGDANDLKADEADRVVEFADLRLPQWTDFDGDPDTNDQQLYDFDPTSIHSLQFQLVTAPGETRPYDFCISNVAWLDEDGNVVDLPWVPSGGGEGGAGAGGEGGAAQ